MGTGESKHRTSVRTPDQPLPPGKPTLLSGAPRSEPDVVTIRWDPPEWNGGAKVTGYIVEHRRIGTPHWVRATPVHIRHHQLTMSGLEPGMRYQFRVFAESAAGRSEPSSLSEPIAFSYHRTFASAPCFVKGLEDTVAIENEKVEFTVQVQGTPTPKLVWYKDGFEIYSSRRQRITMDNDTSTLVIHQAAFNDEGEIKCSATNKAGHIVCKARLRLEAPPTIRLPRQYEDGLLFELGESVRLKISVTGRPQPEVTWLHDGEIITPGGRKDISTTDRYTTLKLSEATRQDRGEYQVKAVNRLGEDITSFLVTITDRPLPPGKAHVVMTLGRSVTLSWSPPSDDGGCKIGNYIVEYYRIGWNMWLKAATCRQLTTTLGDLIEGSEYKFRVKAENPYGISDPSEESDVIFIPDPKRGLLEPPIRDPRLPLNDELSEEWLEARKRHNNLLDDGVKTKQNTVKKPQENVPQWDEESPIPSPVVLANQVLRKVKMAPKRGWSDDSQSSPPRSPERPVPPKRKSKRKQLKALEEQENIKPIQEETVVIPDKFEYHSTEMKKIEETLHSSSELMLVLVPNSRATTEEREAERRDTLESLKTSTTSIAPPISLSAPELGCCEPVDTALMRFAISSSELLHERAMARFYQETADEEAEEELKRKYGIERKRSFERHSPKLKDAPLSVGKETSSSTENISQALNFKQTLSTSLKTDDIPDKFTLNHKTPVLEDTKKEYSQQIIQSEKDVEESVTDNDEEEVDHEYGGSDHEEESENEDSLKMRRFEENEYFMEEEEEEKEEEEEEEETYHPTSMVPKSVGIPLSRRSVTPESMPSSEDGERVLSSESDDLFMPSVSYKIDNNLEVENDKDDEPETIETTLYDSSPLFDRSQSPSVTQPLKPILKVRDSQENLAKSTSFTSKLLEKISPTKISLPNVNDNIADENKIKKKVRIEEPDSKFEEGLVGEGDRDVLLTGEVARNRRKQTRQNISDEEIDATRVLVSLYSDIVREYGSGKKPRAKLYLDYEDLKAAAERSEEDIVEEPIIENKVCEEEVLPPIENKKLETNIPSEIACIETKEIVELTTNEAPVQIKKKIKPSSEFLLDFMLFLIACWLYIFSDERLAIPILMLMVYRQLHETVENKLKKWKKKS